eukprot:1138294-Pelagomonas_calceolata.AAC.5
MIHRICMLIQDKNEQSEEMVDQALFDELEWCYHRDGCHVHLSDVGRKVKGCIAVLPTRPAELKHSVQFKLHCA